MEIKFYQADAFTGEVFKGNPAGVCPLTEELPEEVMQNIALENNLSETAFVFSRDGRLHIRWFTPVCEIDLCGHATLASGHILFHHEGFTGHILEFQSKSGPLYVTNKGDALELDFPAEKLKPCPVDPELAAALGKEPIETYSGADVMAVFENQSDIEEMAPDMRALGQLEARGVIVTAKGDSCDFVSRFFGPAVGIDEDPVTGSAHCKLTPYWHEKTGKKMMTARQLSKRGGLLFCTMDADRVKIAGKVVTYMEGTIKL